MAARAPLAMPHAAASAGLRPAAAPVAPHPTPTCLRARGTPPPPPCHQAGSHRERRGGRAAEGLAQKLQGVEVFDLSGEAVPIVDLWRNRKAVIAFARHFGFHG
nr:unnamed protein product [Digitaria exilis]